MGGRVRIDELAVCLDHDQAVCSFQCSRDFVRFWLFVALISREWGEKEEVVLQPGICAVHGLSLKCC